MNPHEDTLDYDAKELCGRIALLTKSIMDFWERSADWSPVVTTSLLQKSMLHWQTSLAQCLSRWIDASSEGDLILAWANLGVLVEGQLKLFLCVHYEDYAQDIDGIIQHKKRVDPDEGELEQLRQFFVKKIWEDRADWNSYIELVQHRRNAIHAFKQRDIGSFREWEEALRLHLSFLREMSDRLPYPDEGFAGLREN